MIKSVLGFRVKKEKIFFILKIVELIISKNIKFDGLCRLNFIFQKHYKKK
jgi:hypothetical protein